MRYGRDYGGYDRGMRGGYGAGRAPMRGYDRGYAGRGPGGHDRGFRGVGEVRGGYDDGRGRQVDPRMRRGGGWNVERTDRGRMQGGGRGPWRRELMDDDTGGTIGAYGAYGGYGMPRFRSNNMGGVTPGQYYNGYGIGSGYRYR